MDLTNRRLDGISAIRVFLREQCIVGAVAKLDCDSLCYTYWRVIVLYWQWHLNYYGRLVRQLVGWAGGSLKLT